jgi:hypothetical protein
VDAETPSNATHTLLVVEIRSTTRTQNTKYLGILPIALGTIPTHRARVIRISLFLQFGHPTVSRKKPTKHDHQPAALACYPDRVWTFLLPNFASSSEFGYFVYKRTELWQSDGKQTRKKM